VLLFGTLKVQSFVLTEVRDCDLLIVVTSSTFLKRKDMLKEKSIKPTAYIIPAKEWGDTEIAERGRSLLVMRAHYRSAGLTPHQRGWTDTGWTVSRLQLCNRPL